MFHLPRLPNPTPLPTPFTTSVNKFVDGLISSKPMVIFSLNKSPACVTAKQTFGHAIKGANKGQLSKALMPECIEVCEYSSSSPK